MIGSCYSASVLERKGVMESMLSWKANVCLTGAAAFQPWTLLLHESESENRSVKSLSSVPLREGNGTSLQCSCLENPMDGGAWRAEVHGVAEGRTWLNDFTFTFHFHALEKKMATHSSVLAGRIPGTGEPGGLPSTGVTQSRTRLKRLGSTVPLFATPWTVACQAPLSMEFSRQEYWSGELFPSLFKGRWCPRFLGKISQF